MKTLTGIALFLFATLTTAHPGHGKPGWLHFHEFADGLILVVALAAAGLLWRAWKK